MLYYILPNTHTDVFSDIHVVSDHEIPAEFVSNSLSRFLYSIKEKIRIYDKEWDIYKKYTNHYEFIHTIIQSKKKSVSKYKPLSRSYFKMVEIVHELQLLPNQYETGSNTFTTNTFHKPSDKPSDKLNDKLNDKPNDKSTPAMVASSPIKTFHLAEGPGGFIEAVVNMRKNPKDMYYGMTILDDKNDYNIPAWKKSDYFLSNNPNVVIEKGADGTGNILSVENFEYCYETYRSTMDFITADGGFDFSTDFNKQELHISRLLYAQIAFAVIMQKHKGNFVLKIFDCFHSITVDLLFLLSSFYKTVYITKPQTSRSGNSEKYVVCKGFLYHSTDAFYTFIRNGFIQMVNPEIETHYIYRILQKPIPLSFVVKIEEYNSIFGQQQIENIHSTLSMIEKNIKQDRIDMMVKHNITKCIQWCIRYNIPYYNFTNNNAFM
jgi:23S rRNA U2552 (ribose-2'-O)-methylase RlmE/FtsJ